MRRPARFWTIALLGIAAIAGLIAWKNWPREHLEERRRPPQADRWSRVQGESAGLMPEPLDGVALGMTRAEVRRVRSDIRRDDRNESPEPGLVLESENLANGARVVYHFERDSARLQRIQILSLLPSTAEVAPHLAAMNERYGSPTGIWDCPNTGGVPTRRFTWRRAHTTVSDVFLIYGGRVSVTLYVAPSDVIERSLRLSACRPIRSREELDTFPVATPEQMGPAQHEAE